MGRETRSVKDWKKDGFNYVIVGDNGNFSFYLIDKYDQKDKNGNPLLLSFGLDEKKTGFIIADEMMIYRYIPGLEEVIKGIKLNNVVLHKNASDLEPIAKIFNSDNATIQSLAKDHDIEQALNEWYGWEEDE